MPRGQFALDQAAFSTAPSFHTDRSIAPDHGIRGGAAKLRAHRGKRPSSGVEHAHSALPIDEDSQVGGIAVAGHRDVQNLFCLPQERSHKKLIGRRSGIFEEIWYNCCMRALFIGGTGIISTACTQLAAERGIDLTLATRGRRTAPLPAGVKTLTVDIDSPGAAQTLAGERFDVVVESDSLRMIERK